LRRASQAVAKTRKAAPMPSAASIRHLAWFDTGSPQRNFSFRAPSSNIPQ
jgi:hypothetical protein